MEDWTLRIPFTQDGSATDAKMTEGLLDREWLVTNGLGGYASGTLAGAATRRYHGLLISALNAPFGRQVMLNHLMELVRLPNGRTELIGGEESAAQGLTLHGNALLTEFRLEMGLPVWRYEIDGFAFEKRILLPHKQNTVYMNYRLVAGDGKLRLKLRPSLHIRPHESSVSQPHLGPYSVTALGPRYEIAQQGTQLPPLRLYADGGDAAFTLSANTFDVFYRVEHSRGYDASGQLWSPGYFRTSLSRDKEVTLVASTEAWETLQALTAVEAFAAEHDRRNRLEARSQLDVSDFIADALVLAADDFIITPAGRTEDAARARASGEEVRSVIAGYHWFTDWGRDTMISLEGLTLTTGRAAEARWILHTFAHYVRDGLLPNLFPEGEKEGLYHTADASLWFFHTVERYLQLTQDRQTLQSLLPTLIDIMEHHRAGTRFGIGVDPKDSLLHQGAEGYQLTWMDAKVGDWVVTPRRGKAVEINALFYNALRLLSRWLEEERGVEAAQPYEELAGKVHGSFNGRFWYEQGQYLYDVVDGENDKDDTSLRPNQIFALSLSYPVLREDRWQLVLESVRTHLLTPYGLRSLAPGHPDYKPKYYGDLRSRDAAYHQGTVWAWLIGPFVDAWLRVYPTERKLARSFLTQLVAHLSEACVGSISEVFDAEPPYTPRGCIAQAWSVAEVLRCWLKTAPESAKADGKLAGTNNRPIG